MATTEPIPLAWIGCKSVSIVQATRADDPRRLDPGPLAGCDHNDTQLESLTHQVRSGRHLGADGKALHSLTGRRVGEDDYGERDQ